MIRHASPSSSEHDGSLSYLDPARIAHSRWNGVDDTALRGRDFDRLSAAIDRFGGNVQPIKVRSTAGPMLPFSTGSETEHEEFELVFGHSRLLACRELGLPVLALVERLTEHELVQQFAAEFRWHPSWRPWRLGQLIKRTIDDGLFPSLRRTAEALAMDMSEVALLHDLATLPDPVRRAFDNVHFTPKHAKKLLTVFQQDPEATIQNAKLATAAKGESGSSVVTKLKGSPE